ncbi:MAG: molybdenum ABC transporter ATP-binding protein [Deltaproteobacteria bacterium]|nr:molybdenum ABC transporter ATP-binding protein [Deltaproteobacteria bacterium]MDE0342196.1 molybdenum ABC transporter ATP-binding protein [Deltaproteobacteria bacterium]
MLEVDVERRLGDFRIEARFRSDRGVTALFGRSGAGKTSIVNMVSGLLRPDRGRIAVDGHVLFDSAAGIDLPPWKRRLGYVFQEGRLFPHLTVRRNLLYGRRFAPAAERYLTMEQAVELLDLGALLRRRPPSLSGGEKQRVAMGRALLSNPRALLMDEPLASLDMLMKREILPYIERLDEMGIPILYVSHSLDEVSRLARNLVLVSAGRVTASGEVDEILNRLELWSPEDETETGTMLTTRVARHDAEGGITHLEFRGGELRVPLADIPEGVAVRVWIRARDVGVATERPRGLSLRNVLRGTLVEIGEGGAGPVTELRLRIGDTTLTALVTRGAVRELALAPGQEVYALIKSANLDRRQLSLVAAMAGPGSPL